MANVDWPVADTATCDALDSNPDAELFKQAAVDYLYQVTSGKFGTYTEVVRPCRDVVREKHDAVWSWSWNTLTGPYGLTFNMVRLVNGEWGVVQHGCVESRCECTVDTARSLRLPPPVQSIVGIKLDGQTMPQSDYRMAGPDGDVLVRTDGQDWPATQDVLKPATEPDTFQVTYQRGAPVPPGGQLAAEALACELAKAYSGDNSCKLPARVQTITRQGVTVGMVDDFKGLAQGQTGIWAIDSWVASVTDDYPVVGVRSPDVCR